MLYSNPITGDYDDQQSAMAPQHGLLRQPILPQWRVLQYEYEYDVSLTTSKPRSGHHQSQ